MFWKPSFLPARYQATTVNTGAESSAGGRGRQGNGRNPNESIPNIANSTLDKQAQRTQLDLLSRLNQATLEQEVHQRQVEGIMQSYELAFRGAVFDATSHGFIRRNTEDKRDVWHR